MRKFLIALLALVLLGMIPAATMEGLENEILSETVDLTVPEEEVELGGEPEDAGAEEAPEVSAESNEDSDFEIRDGELTKYYGEGGDVVIPASVTKIGYGVFRNWHSIINVRFAEGSALKEIGKMAFADCFDLESIVLPDTVTTIGEEAFNYVPKMKCIVLPDSVTSLGNGAFKFSILERITLSKGLTEIPQEAFYYNDFTSLDIPEGITRIGDNAFKNCEKLERITLPDSLATLGVGAFLDCAALKQVRFGKGLTTIDASAFAGCGFTSLDIPNTVKTVADNAFADCTSLVSASIPSSVQSIGSAFSGCSALESVTFPKGFTEVSDYMFRGCGFKSLTLPDSVTTIGKSAFAQCGSLTSIGIPDGVTDIGESAFADCSALRQVTLSKSITTINTMTFSKCAALESIEVPDGVWGIGNQAFEYCTSLKTVVLPESVREINYLAFRGCKSLETVVIPGKDVSFKFYGSASVTPFNTCGDQLTILCNYGSSVEKYCKENGIAYSYITPPEPTAIALFEEGGNSILFPRDLEVGGKLILEAIVLPEVIDAKLTWKSSDTRVATVKDGVVTAVGPGTAVISATTTNGLSDDMTVNVAGDVPEDPKPTVSPEPDASAKPDDTAKPDATATPTATAKPVSLAKAKVTLKAASYAYTGKAIKPAVTVKLNGKALKKGTDYKVTYGNNKAVGKATVTVKGIGKYTGSVKKAFKIVPKKVAGLKLTAGKGKLVAKWTEASGVDGYELQYGLKKSFSGAKKQTMKKAATVKATIKGLKAGKKYYVRIRSYKTVKGVKYVSAWSNAATGKVK